MMLFAEGGAAAVVPAGVSGQTLGLVARILFPRMARQAKSFANSPKIWASSGIGMPGSAREWVVVFGAALLGQAGGKLVGVEVPVQVAPATGGQLLRGEGDLSPAVHFASLAGAIPRSAR
ncbi:MAG TPA: hypothetical protein VHG52_10710 [Thermomicrobiales bacterium]|nr:hypothetical protein [Thermomicrobiales bacterium]